MSKKTAATLRIIFRNDVEINLAPLDCGTIFNYMRISSCNLLRKMLKIRNQFLGSVKNVAPGLVISVC